MNDLGQQNIKVIKRYYEGCTSGDVELMMSTLAPDVVHYFLEPGTASVAGGEHLARYWRKVQRLLSARWEIDHAIATADEAAIEWTVYWTEPESGRRLVTRGAELYLFRNGLIAEVRAYYNQLRDRDAELVDFDYRARGYSLP